MLIDDHAFNNLFDVDFQERAKAKRAKERARLKKQQQQQQQQTPKPPLPDPDLTAAHVRHDSDDNSYSNPVDFIQSDDPFIDARQQQHQPERRQRPQYLSNQMPEPNPNTLDVVQSSSPAAATTPVDENYSNPVDLIGGNRRTAVGNVRVNVQRQTSTYEHESDVDDIYQLPVNERSTAQLMDERPPYGGR